MATKVELLEIIDDLEDTLAQVALVAMDEDLCDEDALDQILALVADDDEEEGEEIPEHDLSDR